MSQTAPNAAPELSGQDAHRYLLETAYVLPYFQKLAELGHHPANEEDAELYLQMAGAAAMRRELAAHEQLNQRSSGLRKAAARLGLIDATAKQASSHDDWIKAAATELTMNPDVQRAALAYHAALMAPDADEAHNPKGA